MKKRLLTVAFLMGAWGAYSQVGIGTISPNKSSQLEIVAKDKGVLIPQVPLKGLTDKTTIVNGNVSSLLVWNTSSVADVTPGYYYWMQNKWLRILDTDTLSDLDSNTTNSTLSVVGDQLVLTDSDGNKVSIALKSINLPTSLVNNGDGTYTYTSEDGTTSTINVPSDVINNFYDIINNGDVLQDLITVLGDTYVGGNVYYDGTKFTYVDQAGNSHIINFKDVVKANETITKLVNNNNGTYTYTNEAGDAVTIDVPADVINNFEDIITNTDVLKQLVKHLTNTTVGGNVFYDGDKFTYIDENNVVKNITFEEIIKANETLTILNYNEVTNVLTYKDEDGIDTVIDLNIGSITYDSSENRITYKDGNGQSTPLTLNQTSLVYDKATKVLTYTDSKGVAHAIDLGALVAAHETITTLVNNNDGTYTYTNEAGVAVKIDVPADVINNFEDIINEGDVQTILNEYIIKKVGGNVSYDGNDFYYVDNSGDLVKIDIIDKVVNNIKNEGDIYDEIINLIKNNSDVLLDNGNGTFTHTSVNGTPVTFDANTTSVTVADGVYTFLNGKGDIITTIDTNVDAFDVTYNNTISGLTSENVKDAIDELANTIGSSKGDLIVGGGIEFTGGKNGLAKLLSDAAIQIADGGVTASKIGDKAVIATKLDGGLGTEGRVGVANANGDVIYKSLDEVVKANETLTVLAYNNTLNQLTYTDEDSTPKVIDLNVGSISYSATDNAITYTDEKGVPTLLTLNETSLVYDVLTNVLTYTNSKGEAETIDLGALVKANETLTVLAYNNTLNQLTYTDEDSTPKVIDLNVGSISYSATDNAITYTDEKGVPTLLTLNETSLVYDVLTNVLTYTNSKGEAETIDLGALVKANETLTVLAYNNTLNQLTYTDEDSTPKVIDLNVGSISYSATDNAITYTDEKGVPTLLTLNETSLVYDVLTNVLTYTNSRGEAETIDLGALVKANETLTVLAYNNTLNQLTYTDEDSTPKVIDLNVGSISYSATDNAITYTDEKGVPTLLTLNETSLVYDVLTNVLTYTNSKGEAETIDLGALVKANETLTVLTDNGDGTFTYTDEDNGTVTFSANTTTVTTAGGIYTFKDGNGDVITTINTNANSIIFNNSTNGFTSTNVQAAIEELLSKINTVDGTKGNLSVAGGIAFTVGNDGANKLLANTSIEIADGGVTEVKLAPNSVTTAKIADDAVTTAKIEAGVNGDILVTDGGEVKWMSKTDATTNLLSLSGNELTSTVNGVDSSVTLEDVVTSTKGITSNNITVTGGAGATLTDVTLNVTPGTNGQVMVTKNGNTAWVDQSEIVPTTTNILELTDNNLVSNVNGVISTPAVDLTKYLDNTDNQELKDFKIIGTNLSITIDRGNTVTVPLADIAAAVDTNTDNQQITSFTLTGNTLKIILERGGEKEIDLSALQVTYLADGINTTVSGSGTSADKYKVNVSKAAIQDNQLLTVVEQGTGIIVTPLTVDNTTTYTVAANPATIALNGDVTGNASATTLSKIQGKVLEATSPLEGNVLVFEGDKWITKTPSVNAGNVTNAKNLTAAGNATTATIEVVTGGTGATLVETSLRVKSESITTSEIKNGTIKPEDIADAGANQVLVTGSDNKPVWVNQSTLEVTADNGLTKTLNNVQLGGALVKATEITTSASNTLAVKGLDKTKTQGTDNTGVTQHLLAVDMNGDVVKALKAAMPKFFYMPSVLVPTAESQLGQAGVTFNNGTRVGTINLYAIYSAQFGSPVMSSGGTLPVLPSSELDYHITYATSNVFTINSITPSGLLTYTVASGAEINNGSFINIVFSVKEN